MNKSLDLELDHCINVFLSQYKATTRASYKRPLMDMSGLVGASNQVCDLTTMNMLEYIGKVKARDYAPATINKIIKTVKVFFNWCVRMEFIEASPTANIPLVKIHQTIDRDKAMTQHEFDQIIEYFNVAIKYPRGNFRWRDYACFLFLADTGCRRGGVSTLTLDAIDTINKRAGVIEKGEKKRFVYFGDECAYAIDQWIEERRRKGISSKWLFSTTGNQWMPAAVSQMIRRTAKKAGVKKVRSSHSLRHKFGLDMAQKMINPKIVQTAMGHSDVETTIKNYYDTTQAEVQREMQKNAYRPPRKIHIFDEKIKRPS